MSTVGLDRASTSCPFKTDLLEGKVYVSVTLTCMCLYVTEYYEGCHISWCIISHHFNRTMSQGQSSDVPCALMRTRVRFNQGLILDTLYTRKYFSAYTRANIHRLNVFDKIYNQLNSLLVQSKSAFQRYLQCLQYDRPRWPYMDTVVILRRWMWANWNLANWWLQILPQLVVSQGYFESTRSPWYPHVFCVTQIHFVFVFFLLDMKLKSLSYSHSLLVSSRGDPPNDHIFLLKAHTHVHGFLSTCGIT